MESKPYLVVFCTLLVTAVAVVVEASSGIIKLSSRECEEIGFTGLALCSDCSALSEYVKDRELVEECFQCCTEDSDDSTGKVTYAGAILEVCMRKLVFYPEVIGFVEEEKDAFPNLKVNYNFNSPPKLILLGNDGEQLDTIRFDILSTNKRDIFYNIMGRIDNWKREHIMQFLKEKVASSHSQ